MKFPDSILIVDDIEINRRILRQFLTEELKDVVIEEANSGQMAVDLVKHQIEEKQKNYAMIIMDFEMLVTMNGQQATTLIRALESKKKLSSANKTFLVTWTTSPAYQNKIYEGANFGMNKDLSNLSSVTTTLHAYGDYIKKLDEKSEANKM